MARYRLARFDEIDAVRCPCGWARRAFAEPGSVASVHRVDIEADSKVHYHNRLTEIYVILDGEGHLELDGEEIPVRPMTVVMIEPGCRHRAVGKLRILNVVVPPFDPTDEHHE